MTSRRLLLFAVNRASVCSRSSTHRSLPVSFRVFSTLPSDDSPTESHKEYLRQVQELNEERQALFGFSKEEEEAWANPKIHSSSLMDAVEEARQGELQQGCSTSAHHPVDYRQEEAVECTAPFPAQIHLDTLGRTNENEDSSTQEEGALFTHLDKEAESVNMVDVGGKQVTRRLAKAQSRVKFPPEVIAAFDVTETDLVGPKGPIFATAKIAGIMAAKRTSDLIPLCHPLPIDKVSVDIRLEGNTAIVECECRVTHKTGVEMEALVGASMAALTIYDMVKAVSHRVSIEETVLLSKTGGKRLVGPEYS